MKSSCNPFASRHMESLPYQFKDLSLTDLMERLASLNYRGAITGSRGSGKTTLLETIGGQLEQTGFNCRYLYLKEENKSGFKGAKALCFPSSGEAFYKTAVLIDGAEQLSRLAWYRLHFTIKKAGAVVATTHGKSALPCLIHTRTTPALLYDLVLQLTCCTSRISEPAVFDLYHRHHGDIRQALRELYDIWAAGADRTNMPLDIIHGTH